MKKVILETWDCNMARQEWRWLFTVERATNGTFSVSCVQKLINPLANDEPFVVHPVTGLRRGADIYESFEEMLSTTGGNILSEDCRCPAER